ncbi:tetratricopeptide repeat protein [Phaeocystidibacter marisrubri]|nr:tetratricopeptide repeat protein [Phaeocystidibacter marisrubri]
MVSKARLVVFATLMSGGALLAQESTMVSSAILALKRPDLISAKDYIDQADSVIATKSVDDIRESTMQKFLFHRGLIYETLNQESASVEYIHEALENYTALIAYDKKVDDDDYMEEAQSGIASSVVALSALADDAYFSKQDAEQAYNLHSEVIKYKTDYLGKTDTVTVYTMARIATELEKYENALKHYNFLIDNDYRGRVWQAYYNGSENRMNMPDKYTMDMLIQQGKASDPVLSPDINYTLWWQSAKLTHDLGDTAKAMEIISKGLEMHPGNASLQNLQLQFMLETGDYESALSKFEAALESDPTNTLYLYNIGYIYQTKKNDTEKALEFYNRALEVDSTNSASAYMAGYIFIDRTNAISEKMNSLNRNQTSEFNRLDAERDEIYKEALNYFLIAYEADPNDLSTVKALREVYFKLGNVEKVGEFTQKVKALESAE